VSAAYVVLTTSYGLLYAGRDGGGWAVLVFPRRDFK